jgi:hypothetical protein
MKLQRQTLFFFPALGCLLVAIYLPSRHFLSLFFLLHLGFTVLLLFAALLLLLLLQLLLFLLLLLRLFLLAAASCSLLWIIFCRSLSPVRARPTARTREPILKGLYRSERYDKCNYCATALLRGRLHLRFQCAVWMCSKPSAAMTCVFNVQQNSRPISETRHRAACPAARRAACSAACVFDVIFSFQPIF